MSADNIAGRRMGLSTVEAMIENHKARRDYETWLWQTECVTLSPHSVIVAHS